jgi:uncharacterized protein (DUF433 family)
MTDDELRARIVVDPDIMVGQPCIKGTRVPARLILELLAHDATYDEIFEDYPSVTRDDIAACLLYASDALDREATATLAATG